MAHHPSPERHIAELPLLYLAGELDSVRVAEVVLFVGGFEEPDGIPVHLGQHSSLCKGEGYLCYHVALEQLPQEWVDSLKAIEPNTGVCPSTSTREPPIRRDIVSPRIPRTGAPEKSLGAANPTKPLARERIRDGSPACLSEILSKQVSSTRIGKLVCLQPGRRLGRSKSDSPRYT